jgi:hypothetical protein
VTELWQLSAEQLVRCIGKGEASAREAVQAAVGRLDEVKVA